MGRFLVIDSESKSIQSITETLSSIDNASQVESFRSLKQFNEKINELKNAEGDSQKAIDEFCSFDLLIVEYHEGKPGEWEKILSDLKALNKKPHTVILTSYEDSKMNFKTLRQLDIFNIVFKPLDLLILKESLNIALKADKKVQTLEIKSQQTTGSVAILKEIELQSISELGFVTLSDSEIPELSLSKYFSIIFLNGKKQSILAQCLNSIAHPNKPGTYINKFQFVSPEQSFLNTVRRFLQKNKRNEVSAALWNLTDPKNVVTQKLGIVGIENDEIKRMVTELEFHFENLKVEIIKIDPEKKEKQIFPHTLVLNFSDIKHENLVDYFSKDSKFFLLTNRLFSEAELYESGPLYSDIFCKPLDKPYFYKKLKVHNPMLKERAQEHSHLLNISAHEKMKAAHNVKISEINELFINITHGRELPKRSFREFLFLNDDESSLIELRAFSNIAEKAQAEPGQKPGFLHQFIFFGMSDHYLKQIRLWLRHNYIVQNKKE